MLDKAVLEESGFSNVTISNLDDRESAKDYLPFKWKFENAEALSFDNASFDYVIIHAAIHHASMPHKLLTEMYRVARIGLLAFESRDSLTMRLLEYFNLTQVYEHAPVYFHNCQYGGMNNTDIPNFIYRWTEREIEKTIQSYAPYFKHKYVYRYGTVFPCSPSLEARGSLKYVFLKAMRPAHWLLAKIFVKQQNMFAFYVEKPSGYDELFPWLIFDQEEQRVKFNRAWGEQKYKK